MKPAARPTAAEINALPEGVRRYIHWLETHRDPAFTILKLWDATETIAALELALASAWNPGRAAGTEAQERCSTGDGAERPPDKPRRV